MHAYHPARPAGLPGLSGLSGSGATGYTNDRGASFNGTTQYLSATNVSIGVGAPASGTLAFWADLTDIDALSTQAMFVLDDTAVGRLTVRFDEATNNLDIASGADANVVLNAAVDLATSGFHHIAVTSNGSRWLLYVDGTLRTLTVEAGSNAGIWLDDVNPNGAAELYIGANQAAAQFFKGTLDEIGIWNSELTAANITSLYNAGAGVIYGVARDIGTVLNYWSLSTNQGGITAAQAGGITLTNNAVVADAVGVTTGP